MNPFFKNSNIFLAKKIHFPKKNLEKLNIFYEILWIFLKIIENFQFLWSDSINPEKYLMNYIIHLRNFSKPPKMVYTEKANWKWGEISWKFWRESTGIWRRIINFWRIISIRKEKKETGQKRFWSKNEDNFEKSQENFEIFWSKSQWKMDFFRDFFY